MACHLPSKLAHLHLQHPCHACACLLPCRCPNIHPLPCQAALQAAHLAAGSALCSVEEGAWGLPGLALGVMQTARKAGHTGEPYSFLHKPVTRYLARLQERCAAAAQAQPGTLSSRNPAPLQLKTLTLLIRLPQQCLALLTVQRRLLLAARLRRGHLLAGIRVHLRR